MVDWSLDNFSRDRDGGGVHAPQVSVHRCLFGTPIFVSSGNVKVMINQIYPGTNVILFVCGVCLSGPWAMAGVVHGNDHGFHSCRFRPDRKRFHDIFHDMFVYWSGLKRV